MPKYFIYCRKSTEAEDRQVLSIESQKRELIKTFVEKERLDIVAIIEESYSAKAPGREIFNSLIKRIEKGEADGIIAWHPDRLARNSVDGGKIIYLLDTGKIKDLKFSTFTFENNPQGKFMLNIIFGQSKYYVDALSENVKRGMRTKLEMGWYPGKPPIGYLNNREQNNIVTDPERFTIVRKIWDLMLEGNHTAPQILEIANNEWGLRTIKHKKLGGKPLSRSSIYRILSNPFYCGLMQRNGDIYQGKHETMISSMEYDNVQIMLGRNGKPKNKIHDFAYTSLIKCKECGGFITAEEHINRYGSHYVYYRCTKNKKGKKCNQPYIRLDELETQFIDYLNRITISDKFYRWALTYLKEINKNEFIAHEDVKKSLEKALSLSKKHLDNLVKMKYRDLVSDEEFFQQKKELLKEQSILQEKMMNSNQNKSMKSTEDVFSFANQAVRKFKKGDNQRRRLIIKTIGSNFFLNDKKLHILAKKPFEILENGLQSLKSEISMFEPSKNPLVMQKNDNSLALCPAWSGLVDDIRTFFLESNFILGFELDWLDKC